MERRYVTVAEVELAHQIALESGGSAGLRDRGALESAVFRPQTGYYADLMEEAAALFESLVQNHPFVDANKRTAFLATDLFLRFNGKMIVVEERAGERFLLDNLAKGTFRFPVVVEWLRKVVQPLKE